MLSPRFTVVTFRDACRAKRYAERNNGIKIWKADVKKVGKR